RLRFRTHLSSRIMIPSRLLKRMNSIVLAQCSLVDPAGEQKLEANRNAYTYFNNPSTDRMLYSTPSECMYNPDLRNLRTELDTIELVRLMYLSTMPELWGSTAPSYLDVEEEMNKPCETSHAMELLLGTEKDERKTILFLPSTSGGIVFDLYFIRALLRQGHKVILALKEGFLFDSPTYWDVMQDPTLVDLCKGAKMVPNASISKNLLLALLRSHRFLIISDGMREKLNLYKTSVTFSRAWKECDIVFAKGAANYENLIRCGHSFTRDVLGFYRKPNGVFELQAKARANSVRKFSEESITAMAHRIIEDMRKAKAEGRTVMFYSAVIGSIPGQTDTAIKLVNTFVTYLRSRLDSAFIINPAEHFVQGMDGDDLMFMWEQVQRSGLLDVWRFQTVEDIETSFTLLDRKVPAIWSGKDSTFSTGCTKEMRIALDVQKRNPELQIIGPSSEKFFRRAEYGVGKYYDAGITAL
ncbi:MAG: ARMT1-like domain-containing protein, partial [Desulfovibrionales bacterium]|nr:ARMT1-like domain-containing protein [Desulfovibrionales bacterium]